MGSKRRTPQKEEEEAAVYQTAIVSLRQRALAIRWRSATVCKSKHVELMAMYGKGLAKL